MPDIMTFIERLRKKTWADGMTVMTSVLYRVERPSSIRAVLAVIAASSE